MDKDGSKMAKKCYTHLNKASITIINQQATISLYTKRSHLCHTIPGDHKKKLKNLKKN